MTADLLFTKMSLLRCPTELPVCLGLNVVPKLCFSCSPGCQMLCSRHSRGTQCSNNPRSGLNNSKSPLLAAATLRL